jgi:hypothetical protein
MDYTPKRIKVKPGPLAEGPVYDPARGMAPLDPEGSWVDESSFWIRRIKEGSVALVGAVEPPAKLTTKKTKGGEK